MQEKIGKNIFFILLEKFYKKTLYNEAKIIKATINLKHKTVIVIK